MIEDPRGLGHLTPIQEVEKDFSEKELFDLLEISSSPSVAASFRIKDGKERSAWRFFVTKNFKLYIFVGKTADNSQIMHKQRFRELGIQEEDCLIPDGFFFRVKDSLSFNYHNPNITNKLRRVSERKIVEYSKKQGITFEQELE